MSKYYNISHNQNNSRIIDTREITEKKMYAKGLRPNKRTVTRIPSKEIKGYCPETRRVEHKF